jgi:hypothetical protein
MENTSACTAFCHIRGLKAYKQADMLLKTMLPLNRRAVRLSIPAAKDVQPAQKYAIFVAVFSRQKSNRCSQ